MLSAKKIPPGKSGRIEFRVKTEGMFAGSIKKQITVYTNDPRNATVTLTFEATIQPEVELSESSIYFENVPVGKEVRKEILLTIPPSKETKILSVISKDPQVAVRLEPVPEGGGKKFRLIAIQKPSAKQGHHYGNILIKTDSRLSPVISIYVLGNIVGRNK